MTTPIIPLDCDGFAAVLADYLEGDAPEDEMSGVSRLVRPQEIVAPAHSNGTRLSLAS